MKRAMCAYLPQWPLQRLRLERPDLRDQPIAIAQPRTARGSRLLYCNRQAALAGVRPGMPVAEARGTLPRLRLFESDPQRDLAALERCAGWAERFSPRVGLEEGPTPQCLLFDVTGCAPCFRGEERLARLAAEGFRRRGWIARIALADTLGAAWGLAHHRRGPTIAPAGATREAVEDLPLAALRLPADTLGTLAELGVERIGELLAWPRPQTAVRLGPDVLRRLDQMLGRLSEPIVPCRQPPEVQARCSFEYPTDRWSFLEHAFDRLLEQVTEQLRECGRGVRRLECWFLHEAADAQRVEVKLFRPSMSAEHLRQMLRTRLESVRLAQPASGLCLRAATLERLSERQGEWYEADAVPPEELAGLIDRLIGKLGREAVTFAKLVPDPQPEFACRFEPALERGSEEGEAWDGEAFCRRPLALLPAPEPIEVEGEGAPARFRRGGREHAVARAWGPERIETGWWRGAEAARDYFVAETADGARWWLFRRRQDGRWFLHGCFE